MRLLPGCLFLGLVVGSTGCIFVSDDDGGDDAPDNPDANTAPDAEPVPLYGDALVAWPVMVGAQEALACPEGATTAAVYSQLGDGEPVIDLFDCVDFSGTVSDLVEGSYSFWVDLTDDSGATVYAESAVIAGTIVGDATAEIVLPIDGVQYFGSWQLSWQLRDGGNNVSCANTEQNGVSVVSTQNGTSALFDSIYDCAVGEAPQDVLVDPVPVGSYVVSLSALDQDDLSIGDSAPVNATIDAGDGVVDLGTLVINLL